MSLFEIVEALHRAGLHAERDALRKYITERDELRTKHSALIKEVEYCIHMPNHNHELIRIVHHYRAL